MDRAIAEIAGGQQGNIALWQLLDAGCTDAGVRRRVRKGLLYPEFRSVFRVGHRAPNPLARYMAAVLACGDRAVLSGLAAAFVFGLIRADPPKPEVTTTANRRVRGVITHRVRALSWRDVSVYEGIPITTIPRTLVDIAGRSPFDDLAWACHLAEVRFDVKADAVLAALRRRPTAPGARKIREIFEGDGITLSKLERRFIALVRSAGLPLPMTNRLAHGRYVDCRWPDYRLTVELDSYRFHHSRYAWEQDRRRERKARARGDEFRRYAWGDVTEDSELVLAELRPLLREPRGIAVDGL